MSKELLERFRKLLFADKTMSGCAYLIFILADGSEVYIDDSGFATRNEIELDSGEYKLADGNVMLVDKYGQFIETKLK